MKRKTIGVKLTAVSLAAVLLFSGCGFAGEKGGAAEGSSEAAGSGKDVQTLSIAVQMNEKGEYSDENYAINWIQEKMGMKFEFVQLPSDKADADTKLNLMLSSGDYPDIICYNLDKQKTVKLGNEGIFIPINDSMSFR